METMVKDSDKTPNSSWRNKLEIKVQRKLLAVDKESCDFLLLLYYSYSTPTPSSSCRPGSSWAHVQANK